MNNQEIKNRFFNLLESKLGDVKPLISEQEPKGESDLNFSGYKSNPDATNVRYNTGPLAGKDLVDPDIRRGEIAPTMDPHDLNLILSIGAAFIPLAGPFISAGIMLGDAALYASDGDMKNAGLQTMFAMMPGIVRITSKIPAIQKLGQKGMSLLPGKLTSNSKLTQVESEVAEAIAANQQLVRQELSNHAAKLANTAAQKTADKTLKNTLLNIGQKGLSYTGKVATKAGKGVTSLAVGAAPYVVAGQAYDKVYDVIQKDTPKLITKNEQWDWDTIKLAFGSSGSAEDNELLKKAWTDGWRPGTVVPEKYQTSLYKKEYEEEMANVFELENLIANL